MSGKKRVSSIRNSTRNAQVLTKFPLHRARFVTEDGLELDLCCELTTSPPSVTQSRQWWLKLASRHNRPHHYLASYRASFRVRESR